jgi:hypothetical protein
MRILILLTAACLAFATPVRAADSVDMTLVLVSDVSRSVDDAEFKLQKEGYTEAFTSRQVIEAIRGGSVGAIAVAYVEFASSFEVRTVVDWTVIRDEASARDFADRIVAAPRSFWGRTAISSGIDRAVQLLAESGFETQRRGSMWLATAPTMPAATSPRPVTMRCGPASPSMGWRSLTSIRCRGPMPTCDLRVACPTTFGKMSLVDHARSCWRFATSRPLAKR